MMETRYLKEIAEEVLNEKGKIIIEELLKEGNIDAAKVFLLVAVDCCFGRGIITFVEAAEFYNLLDIPPERSCMFHQKFVQDSIL